MEFDNDVKKISERLLQSPSPNKAIYIIQEFIYKIGNGHAGDISIYNGDLGITKALPFSVYIIDADLYINDYPADTTFNGTKIIAIENMVIGKAQHIVGMHLRSKKFFQRPWIGDCQKCCRAAWRAGLG